MTSCEIINDIIDTFTLHDIKYSITIHSGKIKEQKRVVIEIKCYNCENIAFILTEKVAEYTKMLDSRQHSIFDSDDVHVTYGCVKHNDCFTYKIEIPYKEPCTFSL
jgi:hypothetical protein